MDPERKFSRPERVSCPKTGPAASSNPSTDTASKNQPPATRHPRAVAGQEGADLPVTSRGKLIIQSAQRLIPNYLASSSRTPTNIRGTLVQPVNRPVWFLSKLPNEGQLNQMQPQGILSRFAA